MLQIMLLMNKELSRDPSDREVFIHLLSLLRYLEYLTRLQTLVVIPLAPPLIAFDSLFISRLLSIFSSSPVHLFLFLFQSVTISSVAESLLRPAFPVVECVEIA